MIHHIAVGVALERPPRIDQLRTYAIEAETLLDARHTALLMACRGSVMPLWDGIEEEIRFLPADWFRSVQSAHG